MHEQKLQKQLKLLIWATILWNIFEGLASVSIGTASNSISLIAYGLGSGMEVFASSIVLWEQNGMGKTREKRALKFISLGYFFVAAYIYWNSLSSFFSGKQAQKTSVGIILLIATVIIMFALAFFKRRVGKKLTSKTVIAEANFTLLDGSLACAVLIGLVLNKLANLWWVDLLIAVVIASFAVKEGFEEWSLQK